MAKIKWQFIYLFFGGWVSFFVCVCVCVCVCVSLPQPCQVPREWKRTASSVKITDPSADAPNNYGSLDTVDHHCQALTSMPVNLSMNNSVTSELHSPDHGALSLTGETRGGDDRSAGSAPLALVKAEGQTSTPVSCSSGSCQEEPRVQSRMVHEQSCYDLSLTSFLKDKQRSTLDCTYEDAVEGKVRHIIRGWSHVLLC